MKLFMLKNTNSKYSNFPKTRNTHPGLSMKLKQKISFSTNNLITKNITKKEEGISPWN